MIAPRRMGWLLAAALAVLALAVGVVFIAWRQEVGNRAPPRPSRIGFPTRANVAEVLRERQDAWNVPQVWVPSGWFRRRADPRRQRWDAKADETPEHDVHLPRRFWLDTYEVTNARFERFVQTGGNECRELWGAEGCLEGREVSTGHAATRWFFRSRATAGVSHLV